MSHDAAILIDFKSAIDYCQPFLPDNEVTRLVLDQIHKEGIKIEIRKSCWRNLNSSLSNVLNLFIFLRDQATETLRENDPDEALTIFSATVLSQKGLQDTSFSLNQDYMPTISDLQDAVEEMGLEEFRAYADDQVSTCQDGQTRLDLLIDNRYCPGGEDPYIFEASISEIIDDDKDMDVLIDTYIWGNNSDSYLVTRGESKIHSKKDEIYNCMAKQKFEILCPEEITPHMN